MRFPHNVVVYPSVPDEDGFRKPGTDGFPTKAFLVPQKTQDIQRFTGSGARLNTVGELSNITFDVFFPKTVVAFDAFSSLTWDGGKAVNYYLPDTYEMTGEPEVFMNGHGKIVSIQCTVKKVN